jgi:hypothetical protein
MVSVEKNGMGLSGGFGVKKKLSTTKDTKSHEKV